MAECLSCQYKTYSPYRKVEMCRYKLICDINQVTVVSFTAYIQLHGKCHYNFACIDKHGLIIAIIICFGHDIKHNNEPSLL